MRQGKIKVSNLLLRKIKNLPFKHVPHKHIPPVWSSYPKHCLKHFEYGSKSRHFYWFDELKPKGSKKVGYLFTKLSSGHVVPPHRDHFYNFARHHGVEDKNRIRRRLVFLEDWKPGHYFQVRNKVFTHWRQGEWVEWTKKDMHMGGNIGIAPRFVVQITYTV